MKEIRLLFGIIFTVGSLCVMGYFAAGIAGIYGMLIIISVLVTFFLGLYLITKYFEEIGETE